MTDDLRARIANDCCSGYGLKEHERFDIADAVIRELRLVQQSEVYKYGPLMPDGFQKAKLRHRYVTEWETGDE